MVEKDTAKPAVSEKDSPVEDSSRKTASPKKAPAPVPPSASGTAAPTQPPQTQAMAAAPVIPDVIPQPPTTSTAPQPAVIPDVTPGPAAVADAGEKAELKGEEKEEDKMSDEGLGASGDEVSEGSQVRV